MDDEQCRITVVGARRRVDLAVPARAPIAEYLPKLTRLCGQETNEAFPAAWSLALPGAPALSPGTSLADAEVRDGTTLYLRDAVAAETDEPVITDLAELVEDDGSRRPPWDRRRRSLAVLAIGLGAFAAAVFSLGLGSPGSPASGLVALVGGFGAALLAGLAFRRNWPVPAPLGLALALTAVPLLALAGYVLPLITPGSPASVIAVVVGANLGALAAVLAIVDVCTLLVLTVTVTALPVAVLLAALRATPAQSAAVVGVVALGLVVAAPALAGRLAGARSAVQRGPDRPDLPDEVSAAVSRGRGALAALSVVAAVAVTGSMVVLAGSADWFALGLALCLSLALLTLAEQSTVTAAVVPVMAAGVAGLVALAVRAPALLLPAAGPLGPLVACGATAVLLGAGLGLSARTTGGEVVRRSWIRSAGVVLSVLSVPLAVGVFGVFYLLAGIGGRL